MLEYEWGKQAFQRFPELIERFDSVQSPYELWFELREAFEDAYKDPRNEDLISRIYDYANWCGSQPEGKTAETDLGSCVCVCFYEHIPELPAALEDMPRWFSRSDVLLMKDIFSYMVGEEGFERILLAYDRTRQRHKR
jgi:uncharacterized protein YutD